MILMSRRSCEEIFAIDTLRPAILRLSFKRSKPCLPQETRSCKALCAVLLPILTTWETGLFCKGQELHKAVDFMLSLQGPGERYGLDGLGNIATVVLYQLVVSLHFHEYLSDAQIRAIP